MKIKTTVLGLLLAGVIGFSSCNEEEDPAINCSNWSTEYSQILLDLVDAANAWNTNQTTQTCQDLVDGYTAAINSMQDFLDADCIPEGSQSAIELAISSWNSLKESYDCSSVGS